MTYSKEELQAMIDAMIAVSNRFYNGARLTGCHAFIEFTGLMNEYIKLCECALAQGLDFTETTIHGSGKPLPMESYQRAYLDEKLQCIYGHSLDAIMGLDTPAPMESQPQGAVGESGTPVGS